MTNYLMLRRASEVARKFAREQGGRDIDAEYNDELGDEMLYDAASQFSFYGALVSTDTPIGTTTASRTPYGPRMCGTQCSGRPACLKYWRKLAHGDRLWFVIVLVERQKYGVVRTGPGATDTAHCVDMPGNDPKADRDGGGGRYGFHADEDRVPRLVAIATKTDVVTKQDLDAVCAIPGAKCVPWYVGIVDGYVDAYDAGDPMANVDDESRASLFFPSVRA